MAEIAIRHIESECTRLEENLKLVKTAAYTRRKTKPFADDEALPDIVPHIQRLRISTAELEQAKSTEDRRLFSEDLSKEARKEVMIAEMALLSEQLDETRQVARQARKHKEDLLKRETDWNAEFLEAVTQMQNKVRSAEEKAKDRPAVQSSVVLKRRASLNKLVGKLMDNMRSFLDVHYPAPSLDDIRAQNSRTNRRNLELDQPMCSLQDILEHLLAKCIDSPHQPYKEIQPTWWMPFLELLSRSGIIQYHPKDGNRVKLTPFHL